MKYMCKTCKKKCDDILKHLLTVHKFSKATVDSQLATNPNSYQSAFKKLKEWKHQKSDSIILGISISKSNYARLIIR